MHTSHQESPSGARAVLRGVTPRRPLRQEMTLLQTATNHDGMEEVEKNTAAPSSIWERAASRMKHHLLIPSMARVVYYITTLLLLSTIKHYVNLPHIEALTGKKSILNQMFVKKSWGITLSVFFLYRFVSLFLRPTLRVHLKQLMVRSAVTTFFFFIWCQAIFPAIDSITSTCIAGNQTLTLSKYECLSEEGREYLSFDISGHTYLLTYCVLVMMEEGKEILYFLWLGQWLFGEAAQNRTENNTSPNFDEKEVKSLRRKFPWVAPFVSVTFINMCAFALLWDFMIVITTLYYHSFAEKVVGTSIALLTWGLVYFVAFPWLFQLKALQS